MLANHIPKSQSPTPEIEHDGFAEAILAIRDEDDDWHPVQMLESDTR